MDRLSILVYESGWIVQRSPKRNQFGIRPYAGTGRAICERSEPCRRIDNDQVLADREIIDLTNDSLGKIRLSANPVADHPTQQRFHVHPGHRGKWSFTQIGFYMKPEAMLFAGNYMRPLPLAFRLPFPARAGVEIDVSKFVKRSSGILNLDPGMSTVRSRIPAKSDIAVQGQGAITRVFQTDGRHLPDCEPGLSTVGCAVSENPRPNTAIGDSQAKPGCPKIPKFETCPLLRLRGSHRPVRQNQLRHNPIFRSIWGHTGGTKRQPGAHRGHKSGKHHAT